MSHATAEVVSIHIARAMAAAMETVPEARLVAGRGIEGDRYFEKAGTFSKKDSPDREITLIEEEAIAAAARDYQVVVEPALLRRNVVVRRVPLNHLVGVTFRVGECTLEGLKLCEPCKHLAAVTGANVERAFVHRGGLRARIVEGGRLRPGDRIEIP
jgi:MOSC domain-containing protein YiiM